MGLLDVWPDGEGRLALLRSARSALDANVGAAPGRTPELNGASMRAPLSMAGPSPGEFLPSIVSQQHKAGLAEQAREAAAERLARGYYGARRAELPPPDLADMAKSAGVGIVNGLISTAGAIPDLSSSLHEAIDPLIDWGLEHTVGLPSKSAPGSAVDLNEKFGSESLKQGLERLVGKLHEPATPMGQAAETIGELSALSLLGRVLRGGGGALRGARNASKVLRHIGKNDVD